MADNTMVTIVNGWGDKFQIPKAKLEQYKKTWEEMMYKAEQQGMDKLHVRKYEIKEIIEE